MNCEASKLYQPANVPVDADLYRLIKEYRYEWGRTLDLTGETDVGEFLAKESARAAQKQGKAQNKNSACLLNRISVPSGFTYDGASVPRIAWSLTGIRPDGLLRAAAAVHDWIYRWAGDLPEGSHEFRIDASEWQVAIGRWKRKDADRLFGRMMREAGVGAIKRKMAYVAVRLMGRLGWG
ncbi:MAG: DUF1353 domain-containing protein [Leptospiraceae bacterium]|nr:DUF1353 domain-containing protein [Leptospiraceae bacterium]